MPVGTSYPEHDPDRSARWRELVEEIAAANPDTIVIDLASWIHGRDDDRRLRPDGVHFSAETTEEVAEWLAPEILAEYRALKARRANSTATTKPVTRRVLLVGDSVMAETAPATLAAFATAAEPVQARFESLPALPRTEDEVAEWQMLVTSFDPDVVIVYVGFWETAAAGLAVPRGRRGWFRGRIPRDRSRALVRPPSRDRRANHLPRHGAGGGIPTGTI